MSCHVVESRQLLKWWNRRVQRFSGLSAQSSSADMGFPENLPPVHVLTLVPLGPGAHGRVLVLPREKHSLPALLFQPIPQYMQAV